MGKDHTHAQTRIYPYVFPCIVFLRSNMCTLLRGKDTKKKTNEEEDVERVADEIPSELGGEADIIEAKASASAKSTAETRKAIAKRTAR